MSKSIVIKMMFFVNFKNYYVEKCFVNFFWRNIMYLLIRPKKIFGKFILFHFQYIWNCK